MNRHLKLKFALLFALLSAAIILGVARGAVDISIAGLFLRQNRQILELRLLRILMGMLTGSGLAVSGIALQAILRNPLAEPFLLGTSSGAGLGAVVAITAGIGSAFLPAAAFIGAVLSVALVYAISRQGGIVQAQSLILSGVIVSIALSGIVVFLVSVSADEALHGMMWWLWGSLEVYDLKMLFVVSTVIVFGVIATYVFSQDLNAISIGEEDAIHLGIRTEQVKAVLILISSLMTASLVCISGVIGFVGLIIPHIVRLVVGPNHKVLIPAACLVSSAFMILCDMLGRSVMPPIEVPIGVITAVIGAPVFIILYKTKQKV